MFAEEETGNLWQDYLHLLSSAPHWLFEITLMILIDGLILSLAIPVVKSKIAKHDREVHGHKDD